MRIRTAMQRPHDHARDLLWRHCRRFGARESCGTSSAMATTAVAPSDSSTIQTLMSVETPAARDSAGTAATREKNGALSRLGATRYGEKNCRTTPLWTRRVAATAVDRETSSTSAAITRGTREQGTQSASNAVAIAALPGVEGSRGRPRPMATILPQGALIAISSRVGISKEGPRAFDLATG